MLHFFDILLSQGELEYLKEKEKVVKSEESNKILLRFRLL